MHGDKTVIAVIPARAGSSLKDKNVRELFGEPLIYWTIRAAMMNSKIDHIYVSTNCPKVKEVVNDPSRFWRYDVEVIDRPDEMATATSKTEESLLHALEYHDSVSDDKATWVVTLQPTSPIRPMRPRNLIDDAFALLEHQCDMSLMTVERSTPFFVQLDGDKTKWHYDRLNRPMRQEIPASDMYYHDDGCLYITHVDVLRNEKCRLDESPCLYLNDRYSSYQIDEEVDFAVCEAFMKHLWYQA